MRKVVLDLKKAYDEGWGGELPADYVEGGDRGTYGWSVEGDSCQQAALDYTVYGCIMYNEKQ